jgi:hypothetical protein
LPSAETLAVTVQVPTFTAVTHPFSLMVQVPSFPTDHDNVPVLTNDVEALVFASTFIDESAVTVTTTGNELIVIVIDFDSAA